MIKIEQGTKGKSNTVYKITYDDDTVLFVGLLEHEIKHRLDEIE